jgi:hypothetical protein
VKAAAVLLSCFVGITIASAAEKAGQPARDEWELLRQRPHVSRGENITIKLQPSLATSQEEAIRIKKHIANLAKIDQPDFGLSGTMDGTAFTPIPGAITSEGGFLLTNHRLNTTDDFRQLVALGPKALPFLLQAFDDKTPTKLVQTHKFPMGGMRLSTEMDSNPTNAIEQKAVAALPKQERRFERSLTDYTVKVGDVCFTIIGQIVGRRYQAVRYQPTAIIVINSPVENQPLAKAVRDIWSSTNSAQRLLDSLLFDYTTKGVFYGRSLDFWDTGSELQIGAALRMAFYFPQETGGMIAERLKSLDVNAASGSITNHIRREVANGVRTKDFIKTVARSSEPRINQELLDIFKRTSDVEILLAALPAIDASHNELARNRLDQMIDSLPPDEMGPYGRGYDLLVAIGARFHDEAKPTFARYLQNATLQRWRSMTLALRKTQCEWAVDFLKPALTDQREFGWTYALVPGQNEPRRQIRVCDEVAETISMCRRDLHFEMAGEHENLDRQIAQMRRQIESVKP